MHAYLKRLVDERITLTELTTRTADKAATEDRELTDSEKTQMRDAEVRCAEIDPQIKNYNEQLASARAFADLTSKLETGREPEQRSGRRRQVETTSFGEIVRRPPTQFRSYTGRGQSGVVELTDFMPHQQRAAIHTTDLAIPPYVLPPRVQQRDHAAAAQRGRRRRRVVRCRRVGRPSPATRRPRSSARGCPSRKLR